MTSLFITLYLDEDVSILIATLVRARGFDVLTTQAAGQLGASDVNQLAFASSLGRTIVTHNRRDFEDLARRFTSPQYQHAGMILAVRRSPYAVVQRLLQILNHVTADEMQGQVRYI